MVRIIKKNGEAYFCLCGIPFKYSNKKIVKLDSEHPYFKILEAYESLKENIQEDENVISVGDLEYIKNLGETSKEPNEEEEHALMFIEESQEVEGDDEKITIDDDVISMDESGEVTVESGEEEKSEEKSEEDLSEIELIEEKISKINQNIKSLEEEGLEDSDIEVLYLQEIGKRTLLEERLEELGAKPSENKNVVDRLLEAYTYDQMKKSENIVKICESYNVGAGIVSTALEKSRMRFLESVKEYGEYSEDGVRIDYVEEDGKFVFSGDKVEESEKEEILLVEESDFFTVFDELTKELDKEEEESNKEEEKEIEYSKVQRDNDDNDDQLSLQDGKLYETACNVYRDSLGVQSAVLDFDSHLYCRKGVVGEYLEQEEMLIDEYGNMFQINKEFLKEVEEPISSEQLSIGESYDIVDDSGKSHGVKFERQIEGGEEELFEFKNRLKESIFVPKRSLVSRIKKK